MTGTKAPDLPINLTAAMSQAGVHPEQPGNSIDRKPLTGCATTARRCCRASMWLTPCADNAEYPPAPKPQICP